MLQLLHPTKLEACLVGFVLLLVFGVACFAKFKVSERRFMRRNFAGYQLFTSYGRALVTESVEGFVYSIASIAQAVCLVAFFAGAAWFALH